ncbi:MAG: LytTR family DNA-binding domain-containing protein [Rhodospirillaceae bacterium]
MDNDSGIGFVAQSAIKDRFKALGNVVFPFMSGRQVVTFYVLVPVSIGAILGWYRAGYTAEYPIAVSLFEWIANFFALWVAFDLGSRLAAYLMRPWTPPLWLILILGGLAGVAVSRPLRSFIRDMAGHLSPGIKTDIGFPPDLIWQEFVFAYLGVITVPIMIWVLVNYVYHEALHLPRYGCHGQKKTLMPDPIPVGAKFTHRNTNADQRPLPLNMHPPEFMKRLTAGADAEIIALQAEDHYLRVFTGEKNELIRYRFSDAIDEVHELPGLQVHRSFWVSTAAIESIRRAGRSYEIKMTSGLSVPVSRSYRYALKDAGLLDKFLGRVPNNEMVVD